MKFNGHKLAQEYSIQVYYTIHHRGRADHEEQVNQGQKTT